MGKKGSKRKTRWRTISIGAPPSEEDEAEGLRNGYTKVQGNEGNGFKRNGQTGYKPWRTTNGSGSSSGYGSAGTAAGRSQEEAASGPAQSKIIFNEEEYTRITTPRQDVLFKKGYLSRKKPWTSGNASTSATPSTTESQSASHSTADGSETTEDQQLLDRDNGMGEYPAMVEPGAQMSYGTFYNQTSGYYYEYPVMLVGPAPIPAAQVGPSVLASVPCGPVPLRPIEWMNPAFLPKLAGQPYCVVDYQMGHNAEDASFMEEQDATLLSVEGSNGPCVEKNDTESTKCNGDMDGEIEEETGERENNKEQAEPNGEQHDELEEKYPEMDEEHTDERELENGVSREPYLEPMLVHQPVHVPHMLPSVPQPYMYPGHYMFGPPLVNVNGVTIQSGPMIRTTDVAAMTAVFAKRRKKKKRRKQKRAAVGNTEDEEEGEYSSEYDNASPSSRATWTDCSTSTTTTTTTTTSTIRPLNPECPEFQLRTIVAPHTSLSNVPNSDATAVLEENSIVVNHESSPLSADTTVPSAVSLRDESACNGLTSHDRTPQGDESMNTKLEEIVGLPSESSQRIASFKLSELDSSASERLNSRLAEKMDVLSTNAHVTETINGARTEDEALFRTDINANARKLSSANQNHHGSQDDQADTIDRTLRVVTNEPAGHSNVRSDVAQMAAVSSSTSTTSSNDIPSPSKDPYSKSAPPEPSSIVAVAGDSNSNEGQNSRRKRSVETSREPTLNPDLDLDAIVSADHVKSELMAVSTVNDFESVNVLNSSREIQNGMKTIDNATMNGLEPNLEVTASKVCQNLAGKAVTEEVAEGSNEDSGFESQTRGSDYPITKAVTQWLQRVNSPEMFILSTASSDSGTEDEDELEPPKNLQGNPMPALSANSDVENAILSRPTSCGEFARINSIKIDQSECKNALAVSKRKRDVKEMKRKSGERTGRRVRNECKRAHGEAVSSSDSCSLQDESITTVRRKNLAQQDVDDICEFTEKDSVAGMRVATSSRMDLKKVSGRRMKKQGKPSLDSDEANDVKMQRIEDTDGENDEGIIEDTIAIKTFEQGEIVVSEDGKFLAASSIFNNNNDASSLIRSTYKPKEIREVKVSEKYQRNESYEEDGSVIVSLDSIDEPDVLECWEAETIEPVITPKKILQSRGILYEGEAAEEDSFETEPAHIEHVQKYYRLARGSAASIGEEASIINTIRSSSLSRTVPNSPDQMIESFCSEEVPVVMNVKQNGVTDQKKVPIDEAFEVYESCYAGGKPQFASINSNMFKPRMLYGQKDEGPIPCRAVCCNIQ